MAIVAKNFFAIYAKLSCPVLATRRYFFNNENTYGDE